MAARDDVRRLLEQGKKQSDIASELGISPGRVSQLVKELRAAVAQPAPPPASKSNTARTWGKPAPKGNQRAKGNRGGPGGPVGNKHAVTTGEHETIWDGVLDPEERHLFRTMDTGKLAQIEHEIKLITIRERRMLQRIEALRQQADADGMTVVEISREEGSSAQGPINKTTNKREGTLGQIQAIEDALTRVQDKKTRLLELKHKIENDAGAPTKPDVGSYVTALTAAAGDVWAGENPDDEDGDAE